MRFPGGCDVEGSTFDNAWRWTKTVGELHLRPGRHILWDYHTSDGFGYLEYLQLCEDLGAEPLLVVNAGTTDKDWAWIASRLTGGNASVNKRAIFSAEDDVTIQGTS